jgi:hypothetical protein
MNYCFNKLKVEVVSDLGIASNPNDLNKKPGGTKWGNI